MKDLLLQLKLAKTEKLVFSDIQQLGSTITPPRTARNLRVVIDDQLNFTDHIARTAWSCKFALG